MKKSKLLVVGLAAAALGLAGAASGTVAWFAAENAASISKEAAHTSELSTKASELSFGHFVVTPVIGSPSVDAVSLTDTSGKSYVYVDGVLSQKVEANPVNPVAKITVQLNVKYVLAEDEEAKTPAEVKSVWLAALKTGAATITATCTNGDARFLEKLEPGEGEWTGSASKAIVVANTALTGISFGEKTEDDEYICTSDVSVGDYFVAVTGKEEVQTATSQEITFTPTIA